MLPARLTPAGHFDGSTEYNAHNLFGTAMAATHYPVVANITGKRPFLLSRSTFPGAGRYTAHWCVGRRKGGQKQGEWWRAAPAACASMRHWDMHMGARLLTSACTSLHRSQLQDG